MTDDMCNDLWIEDDPVFKHWDLVLQAVTDYVNEECSDWDVRDRQVWLNHIHKNGCVDDLLHDIIENTTEDSFSLGDEELNNRIEDIKDELRPRIQAYISKIGGEKHIDVMSI